MTLKNKTMTEQELKARIEPLGKRTRYELIRALYIWVSYGVKVQFSHLFSKKGMCVFNRLCEEFPPQFTEEDEKKKEKLMKNANIAVTIGTLCRKLQNFVENYKVSPLLPTKKVEKRKPLFPPYPLL